MPRCSIAIRATGVVTLFVAEDLTSAGDISVVLDDGATFDLFVGGDVRLVLPGEKLTIWGRPLAFEFDANDGVVKYYDFLFGININF